MFFSRFVELTLPSFLMITSTISVFSQSVAQQSIAWHATTILEKHSDETVQTEVEIKTFGSNTVELHYPNETLIFNIQAVVGAWQDPATNGTLTYRVDYQGTTLGKFILTRSGDNISIEADFTEGNEYGLHQVFNVASFQPVQP
jgi:hypothetical protein